MKLNPDHYTPLIPLSPSLISYVQDSFGAGMWFNALVNLSIHSCPDRKMKYGIISKKRLLKDLIRWTTLYSAGRLHKPVRIIQSDPEIDAALQHNNDNAVKTALLMMPSKFSEMDLFLKIASLSYIGDLRMNLGENPRKVTKTYVFTFS